MKNIFKKFMLGMLVTCLTTATSLAVEFTDVKEGHWAYKQITELADEGIVVGYPDNSYQPDEPITRAEFASVAIRGLKKEDSPIETPVNFSDVPNTHWAWGWVERAAKYDLIKDTKNTKFRPDDHVTRAECIEVIVNALTTKDLSKEEAQAILEKSYIDHNTIPEWFIVKAGKAKLLGIVVNIPGEEANIYANRPATRAEVAAFIDNMLEKVKTIPNDKIKAEMKKPISADGFVIVGAESNGPIGKISRGSYLPATLDITADSQKTPVGTEFNAQITENLVTYEHYLLIPKGSVIKGKLLARDRAFLFFRNGKVVLEAQTLDTPVPQTTTLKAVCESDPDYSIWRKIFKGKKFVYKAGEQVKFKLLRPMSVDLTNTTIIEE